MRTAVSETVHTVPRARGGDFRGDGGTRPPTFWLGDAKVNGSLQNAYLGEELKGFCIIKIQFLFS